MSEMLPQRPGEPAIRVSMMPRDTNAHGTIFGGVLLSYIDQAGAIEARKLDHHRFVTVAMDAVEFKQPVYVGDVLSFYTRIIKLGRTSVRVGITVVADRFAKSGERVHVTQAEAVYVAIDEHGRPVPLAEPAV
jgi:acyl-CoA thioesterase YciA